MARRDSLTCTTESQKRSSSSRSSFYFTPVPVTQRHNWSRYPRSWNVLYDEQSRVIACLCPITRAVVGPTTPDKQAFEHLPLPRHGQPCSGKRKNMTSSPSSSGSSAYTSTDEARRYYDNDKRNFLDSGNVGTTRLLRSYSGRGKEGGCLGGLRAHKSYFRARNLTIIGAVVGAVVLAIIVAVSFHGINKNSGNHEDEPLIPPDPETTPPPSASKLRTFQRGAVCADGAPCAVIGKSILEKNGSAVDAALATMICNGLVNMQSMGLGGGFVMTIYDRASRRAYTLNARDRAPLLANATMFDGKPEEDSFIGPLAIGVPGELAGYWAVHQRFGKLPWSELFRPTIDLCENGYNLTKIQHDGFRYNKRNIFNEPILKELFVDPETNDFYNPGTIIRPKVLCKTLRLVAEKTATEFYNGTLGRIVVEDLQKKGSIITMKDLNEYRPTWDEPLQTTLSNGMKIFTIGLPASGGLLAYILNVLDEFRFTPDSIATNNATILTYHRMMETYKYAYALRSLMGDKDYVNITELSKNLTSREYARATRLKIDDRRTWDDPEHYGASQSTVDDHGTAHVSILAPNGDAVAATSTINFYFGSGVVSDRTGIIFNNAMNDFGIPSTISYFGVPPSPNNFIAPGKRPLSSMVPSIFIDPQGDVRLVVGASGGTKITTAVTQIVAKILWMGQTVKEAVDAPRVHHQLLPNEVNYEFGIPSDVIDGLRRLGHKTTRYRIRGSVACVVYTENGTIYANADYRKGGDVYGVD